MDEFTFLAQQETQPLPQDAVALSLLAVTAGTGKMLRIDREMAHMVRFTQMASPDWKRPTRSSVPVAYPSDASVRLIVSR